MTLSAENENTLSDGLPITLTIEELMEWHNLPLTHWHALDSETRNELTYCFFTEIRWLFEPQMTTKEKLEKILSNLWK